LAHSLLALHIFLSVPRVFFLTQREIYIVQMWCFYCSSCRVECAVSCNRLRRQRLWRRIHAQRNRFVCHVFFRSLLPYLTLPYLTLPYLRGGQVVTPAQRWGRIDSAQCATPDV